MESIDTSNLAIANKGFNKPYEYKAVLERLAQRDIHAITSFIFGMDNDKPGAAEIRKTCAVFAHIGFKV